jgi:hypothetical protein
MAEITQYTFSHRELVEILVKQQDLHEGIWGLYVRFGLGASNVGESPAQIQPAAIIPVVEIGLQKFDKETNISVDAAKVNPKPQRQTAMKQ